MIIGSRDDDGQAPFSLTVLNPAGQAIDWLWSEWWRVGESDLVPREPAPWNSVLEDLYRHARSSAVDLEGVIGGILEEVENPIEPVDFGAGAGDDIPF